MTRLFSKMKRKHFEILIYGLFLSGCLYLGHVLNNWLQVNAWPWVGAQYNAMFSEQVAILENLSQCIEDERFSAGQCKADMDAAFRTHQKFGPRYTDAEICQKVHGEACRMLPLRLAISPPLFEPPPVGWMTGIPSISDVPPQVVYGSAVDGSFMVANGELVRASYGDVRVPNAAIRIDQSVTINIGGSAIKIVKD